MRRALTVFALAAVMTDLCYTAVFWLAGGRQSRLARRTRTEQTLRYLGDVALMSAEVAAIHALVRRLR